MQEWDCGSPFERKAFPCGWEGAVMTPREPFSTAFQQQPQPAAVSRMAMNMHKYWKIFFQQELGPLPEVVYTQVTMSGATHCIILPAYLLHAQMVHQHYWTVSHGMLEFPAAVLCRVCGVKGSHPSTLKGAD